MGAFFVRSCNPVICDPLFSLQNVTASVQAILVPGPHPTALLVQQVIVPHDRGAFLWADDKVTNVTVVAEVVEVQLSPAVHQNL